VAGSSPGSVWKVVPERFEPRRRSDVIEQVTWPRRRDGLGGVGRPFDGGVTGPMSRETAALPAGSWPRLIGPGT